MFDFLSDLRLLLGRCSAASFSWRCSRSLSILGATSGALVGFLLLSAPGCAPDPPGGLLVIGLETQPFPGLRSINVTAERVDIVLRDKKDDPTTERLITLVEEEQFFSFAPGFEDEGAVVRSGGVYQVPAGFLTQIRFVHAGIVARFEDVIEEVEIFSPSGEETGLKVVSLTGEPFEIKKNHATAIKVLFDPAERLVLNLDRTLIKPTIPAILVSIEDLLRTRVGPEQALVLFRVDTTEDEIRDFLAAEGISIMKRNPLVPRSMVLNKPGSSVPELVDLLNAKDIVEAAAANVIGIAQREPNDRRFGGQDNLIQIDCPAAWDVTVGTGAILIAVLDTGADLRHRDLINNLWVNVGELPGVVVTDVDGNGLITYADFNRDPAGLNTGICDPTLSEPTDLCDPFDLLKTYGDAVDNDGSGRIDDITGFDIFNNKPMPQDDTADSHGTHVAGILGAVGNNGDEADDQIAGVMWNAAIVPLKITDDQGDGLIGQIHEATSLAVFYEARIVNVSIGALLVVDDDTPDPDATLAALEGLAEASGIRSVLFVAGAGNEGQDLDQREVHAVPAEYAPTPDTVIAVGAVGGRDRKSGFSNFSPRAVDLGAPGNRILSLEIGGGKRRLNGTSMAAPHVSGSAGLVLEVNDTLTPVELKELILQNVDRIDRLKEVFGTGGRLNAARAVAAVP